MKKIFLILFSLLFIVACNPDAKDSYSVNNKTGSDIKVWYERGDDDSLVIVPANMETIFFENKYQGNAYDEGDNFLIYFDRITIERTDSIELTKDYKQRNNWKFWISDDEGLMNGGTAHYMFEVED